MKAVTFYFQNLESNLCLYRFAFTAFLPFIVDLTFGKIWNIYEKSHTVGKQLAEDTNNLAHVQKIPFLQMLRSVPFKKYGENYLEETYNHPNL